MINFEILSVILTLWNILYSKVCCDWREIALIMRDRVFEEKKEQCIDIHDVKVDVFEFKIKLN